MPKQPLLVVLVGTPGSGKSYFAKRLAPILGAVRLNGDSMKTAIYGSYDYIRKHDLIHEANKRGSAAIDYAVEEVLRAGYSVVYDMNNNKLATRNKNRALAERHKALQVVVWIRVPEAVAKERVMTREETIDQLRMDAPLFEDIIKRQMVSLDPPTADEKLIEIDGTLPFEEQYLVFKTGLEVFGNG